MEKVNKLIRLSGIICILLALFFVNDFGFYQASQLAMGVVLLAYSNLSFEDLTKKKTYIVVAAIIALFLNIISSIMLFIVMDELSGNKSKKMVFNNSVVNSEARKIDILLKIGIGMILVAGILIATTSWNVLPDIVKCIGLLGLSGIFIGLAKFSEVKLKIYKTTKAYYVVGLCLGWLSFVCVGVLEVFSKWFSYIGEGANLVWFITLILLSGVLYLINNKFKEHEYKYMAIFVCWISLNFLLAFMGLGREFVGLVISVLLLLINLLLKGDKFKLLIETSRIVSYVYWPLLLNIDGIGIVIVITLVIAIINMLYLIFEKNNNNNKIMTIIISYLLGIELISQINIGDIYIIIFVGVTIFYCVINYSKIKAINNVNQVVYNIISSILIVLLLDNALKVFVISVIYGIVHFLNYLIINKVERKFDGYYQPMVIWIMIYGIMQILNEVININVIYYFIIPALIYAFIEHYVIKEKKNKKIYYVYLLIITIITFLINIIECDVWVGILLIGLVVYIFLRNKEYSVWTYILLLFAIILFKHVVYEHFSYGILLNFLNILVFGGLTYLFKDNSVLRKINLISIVIPVYTLIGCIRGIHDLRLILNNILSLYILFIIITQFVGDNKSKDIIATIFTSLCLLEVIFVDSLLVGLYVGVLGVVLVLITYNKKKFKGLFYCGIIVTILNVLIKLGDFWSKIPLSVYLLLAGGVLIAFVTFKELKNKEQIGLQVEERVVPKVMNDNEEVKINFCPRCGRKTNGNKYCANCGMMLIKK